MIHDKGPINYDGTLLKQKFGFDFYQEKYNPNGIVVIAYGSTNIGYDGTFFLNDYPTFDDAIHICWEIPNLNSKGNAFFKQLLLIKIFEKIQHIKNLKLDDSFNIINTETNDAISLNLNKQTDGNVALGYVGLDNTILNVLEKDKKEFSEKIEKQFYNLLNVAFIDTIKTT